MKFFHRECPIAVISTSTQGSAAIGMIRFTGFDSIELFSDILTVKNWKPRFAHFTKVLGEQDELLDEGIALYFEAPNSFTGENVLELQLHGNPINLDLILRYIINKLGFSSALPGEFTYRAFKNGKLNLNQVEGLDLLLNASSGYGLSAANKVINNELYKSYLGLREDFLELKASVEIAIDFSEDVGQDTIEKKISGCLNSLKKRINGLYLRTQGSLSDLLNPSITFFGKTNAGKSTLFNSFVGKDRAIVSNVHGTTRDYVSEYWYSNSLPFKLNDTAGLRETSDSVEIQGIEKTNELLKESFFKVLVLNPFQVSSDIDEELFVVCDAIVVTHLDLVGSRVFKIDPKILNQKPLFSLNGPIGPGSIDNFGPIGPVFSSSGPMGAKKNGPIGPKNSLEEMIIDKYQLLMKDNPIPIQRHREIIGRVFSKFQVVMGLLESEKDMAIISNEINTLGIELEELLGIVNSSEVLDHIFANFCIGK